MKKLLLVLSVLFANVTFGTVCTASTGNWSVNGTWSCGSVPADGDTVVIPDGVTVTVNSANQYSANGGAPYLVIYVGEDDGDSDGGAISFDGKLNLKEGSPLFVYEHSVTTADAPGNSEKIRWYADDNTEVATLSGDDVAFTGPVTVTDGSVASGILPVEYSAFTLIVEGGIVMLNWSTAAELNNSHFIIQRSINLKNWENIGRVSGNGTTYNVNDYSFEDYNPEVGDSYYRLSQVDYDGTVSVSKILSAQLSREIGVYPNPSEGDFTVVLQKECQGCSINLMTPSFEIVYSNSIEDVLDVETNLPAGVYYLHVQEGNETIVEKVIIR